MRAEAKAGSGVFAVIAAAFIALPEMIQLLIYAISIDVATGIVAAWSENKLSSAIGRQGVGKKAIMILAVAGAEIASRILEFAVHTPWGDQWSIGSALAAYYCIQEALSVLENLTRAGVPFPRWIVQRLMALREEADK